jgi:hypothetical protein
MKAKLSQESYRRGTGNTPHKYSRRAIYHEILEPTILFLPTVEKFLNNLHTQGVLSEMCHYQIHRCTMVPRPTILYIIYKFADNDFFYSKVIANPEKNNLFLCFR